MLKKRALSARVVGGFSGVLFAVCGALSAGYAENAAAQTAMQVYEPVGMLTLKDIDSAGNIIVDGSQPLSVVAQQIAADVFATHFYFRISTSRPGGAFGPASAIENGIPCQNSNCPQEGEIIELTDNAFGTGVFGTVTVRLYERDGVLYMAGGEEPATMAATVTRPQFFLNTTSWTMIPIAAECTAMPLPQILDGDDCRPIVATDCTGSTPAFDNGMCVESCPAERPQQTGNTCRATEAADCTGATSIFDDGMCVESCPAERPQQTGNMCEAAPPDPTEPTNPTDCPDGETRNDSGVCIPDSPAPTPTDPTPTTTLSVGGDDETKDLRNILGIAGIGMFFATWAFSDDLDNYEFSPSFGYSVNESGYSANAGGRLDFRKGDWSAYWTAGQINANGEFGDFRYASGGEYKADFWQAAFSESVQGKTADYDFALSADWTGGIWSLSPVYRMHSRFDNGESATRNSLNLESVLRYDSWRITQSAGFGWRRAEDFGDSAKFRLEAVREF